MFELCLTVIIEVDDRTTVPCSKLDIGLSVFREVVFFFS
jgi:hypothetical protein